MRTLGLLGGTSWHATVVYYSRINNSINDHFGNNTNPPLILYNINQAMVHQYQKQDEWKKIADLMFEGGQRLLQAGAEGLLMCANTPHKIFDEVQQQLPIPLLHIADATADAIVHKGLSNVCFLGTKFSMQEDFITGRIRTRGIEVLVPSAGAHIAELHRIIHEELTFGKIVPSSRQFVLNCLEEMRSKGAEGVILGCTEFPLLIKEADVKLPIFDTIEIHAKAATDFTLSVRTE